MSEPARPAIVLCSGVTGGAIDQADIDELNIHLGGTEEVSSFSYRLQNWNGKYSPSIGNPIALGEDGYILMGRGANCPQLITTRNENMKFQSSATEHYVTVSGRDWGERLFREYVTESYVGMKGEEIVKHMLDYHSGLPHVRSSIELVENTDTTFTRLEYENQQAWEILKQIAQDSDKAGAIGYDFRVAPDGRFEFFHRGAKACTVDISECVELAETESDILSVRNKVTIYGAATKTVPADVDETVESLTPISGYWTGYGGLLSLSAFTFGTASSSVLNTTGSAYNAISVFYFNTTVNANKFPKLFLALLRDDKVKADGFLVILHDASSRVCGRSLSNVNSTASSSDWTTFSLDAGVSHGADWGAPSNFDWENIRTVTITAYLETPGVSGQVWHGQLYFTGARFSSVQTDAASIATYGERQHVDIIEDLYSDNECMLRAKSILAFKKQAKTSLIAKSTLIDYGTSPILPGDMIPVTLPNENISAVNFLVKSVDYHFVAQNDSTLLELTLNLGYQKQKMADYVYALRAKMNAVNNYKVSKRLA